MALTVTSRQSGTPTHNTSSASVTITPGGNFAAGSTAVLVLAYDNSGTSGADPFSSISDSLGNVWTSQQRIKAAGTTANGSTCLLIATSEMAKGKLTTSDTITVNFSPNVTAKAWALWEVVGGANTVAAYVTGGISGAATGNPTITTGTIPVGDVVIGGVANEYGTAQTVTHDSDTTNGSWAGNLYAEIGTTNAGQNATSAYKVQTTANSTQTYNPTYATSTVDRAIGWIQLHETPVTNAPAGLASGTGEASAPTANPGGAAGAASGTGEAPAALGAAAAMAGVGSGTGAGWQPTAQAFVTEDAPAGLAAGTGSALGPIVALAAMAPAGAATGSAPQPSVSAFVVTSAPAGVAAGTAYAEWAGAGGTTTVGSDTFTGAAANLSAHTAETGGTWAAWWWDAFDGNLSLNGSGHFYADGNSFGAGATNTWAYRLGSLAVGDGQVALTVVATDVGVLARMEDKAGDGKWSADAYVLFFEGGTTYLYRLTGGLFTVLGSVAGTPTGIKLDVSGSSPTTLKARAWTGTEPGTWGISTSDNTAANQRSTGGVGVIGRRMYDGYDFFTIGEGDNFSATTAGAGGAPVGPSVRIAAMPPQAAGTGTAQQPTGQVRATAGVGSGTGTAQQPTVTTFSGTSVDAGLAAGTGASWQPVAAVSSFAPAATGAGSAPQPTASVAGVGGLASGTGTAPQPTVALAGFAPAASGTGTAHQPLAAIAAMPGVGAGTGTAQQPTVTISGSTSVNAGAATGTGSAGAPTAAVAPMPPAATGIGAAWQPTAGAGVAPSAASGTGASWQPAASLAAFPATATGTGSALAAIVQALALTSAQAGVAEGIVTAWVAGIATSTSYGGVGPAGTAMAVTGTGAAATLDITGSATTGGPSGGATSAAPSGKATNVRPG